MSGAPASAFAAYDDPALQQLVSFDTGGGRRRALIRIEGMHCSACERRLQHALQPLVEDLLIQRDAATAEFSWRSDQNRLSEILAAIDGAGLRPLVLEDRASLRAEARHRRSMLKRIGVAGLLGMQVMMLASSEYFGAVAPELLPVIRWACLLLATPVAFYSGWPFFRGAAAALAGRSITMDVPVALAIGLAWAASAWHTLMTSGDVYFESVVMFVLLLLGARYFQEAGRARAARQLRALASAQALTATRIQAPGSPASAAAPAVVAVQRLAVGDWILVAPGEAVPVDGCLLDDGARLDEALLTGEAVPAHRRAGERALAGSVNAGALPLRLRVESVGADTTLSQTLRLLHRAQAQKPRVQRIADRIAGYFLSAMLLLCALAWLYWLPQGSDQALAVVLALLVATCPCALSMAVPTALAAAGSRLAKEGILLARADALMRLQGVDRVCFDKTGTLTTGELHLARVETLAERDATACTAIAAAIEGGSRHPIARAFAAAGAAACPEDVVALPAPDFALRARIGTRCYLLGAADRLLPGNPLPVGDGLSWLALLEALPDGNRQAPPATAVVAARYRPLARFGLAAIPRPGAEDAVAALRAHGLGISLLSGDGEAAVSALAQQLHIDDWQARLRSEDKLAIVQRMQDAGHGVLAVGDGVNDAPLLAAAQVSIAMGSGSALAQTRADLLLTRPQLDSLPLLIDLARRCRRIVAQNLFWALGYNSLMVPLAFSGALAPWMGALGMGASSLLVVANALRLGGAGSRRNGRGRDPAPGASARAMTVETARG